MKYLTFLLLFGLCFNAMAEVKDYQVIRLIALKSECVRDGLERAYINDTGVEFSAACTNLSHYPNGIKVFCDDRNDERSCRILTKPKSFEYLNLLQSSNPDD